MTVADVRDILGCELVSGQKHIEKEVHTACGSDMMSDVLAFVKDQSILLTGLVNPQVIRTADMMDMLCIIFVRGKKPDDEMVKMADERGIALMTTSHRMFAACGLLWENGLRGGDTL